MTTTATAPRPPTRPTTMTADDLLAMPDDGFRYELVRGELRKMPPPGWFHGKYAASVVRSLDGHVWANDLGDAATETGFRLADDHVRAPDASFVRKERADAMGSAYTPGFFPGPPDIAVEVISPSDRYRAVAEKVADWLAAGTLAVITVNPRNRTVEIHRPQAEVIVLNEGDILEVQDVVPGWRMPVSEIFRVRNAESNRNS